VDVAELTVILRAHLATAYEASVVEVFKAHVASPAAAGTPYIYILFCVSR